MKYLNPLYVRILVCCESCYNPEKDIHPPEMKDIGSAGDETEDGTNTILKCERCGKKTWIEVTCGGEK